MTWNMSLRVSHFTPRRSARFPRSADARPDSRHRSDRGLPSATQVERLYHLLQWSSTARAPDKSPTSLRRAERRNGVSRGDRSVSGGGTAVGSSMVLVKRGLPTAISTWSDRVRMRTVELTEVAVPTATRVHLRVAWLCGAVLFLEAYYVASVGNAVPSLVDAWNLHPAMFTQALTAGNAGLLLGLLGAGLLSDRLRRRPLLICCVLQFGVFSLLRALAHSPLQLEILRLLTGLGLGGGELLAIVTAADFAPRHSQARLVILIQAAVPMGQVFGGLPASQLVRAFGWPAILVAGGVLPIAVAPLLVLLPNAAAERRGRDESRQNPVAARLAGPFITAPLVDNWELSVCCVARWRSAQPRSIRLRHRPGRTVRFAIQASPEEIAEDNALFARRRLRCRR
jgi:hypothetical protein